MATYLITGTARGIGLELTRQLTELPSSVVATVFAVSRSGPSGQLEQLIANSKGRIVSIIASVNDIASIENAAKQVEAHMGGQGLDVLVNNAAIQATTPNGKTDGFTPEQLTEVLDTNVVGVHRAIRAFLPLLKAGKQKKVINISSTMGSISMAPALKLAPGQIYKTSKAALHMLTVQYSLDYAEEGFTFLCVSPGHLRTDLGGPGDFDVDVGTAELKRITLAAGTEMNGKFVNIHVPGWEDAPGKYDGKEIPW